MVRLTLDGSNEDDVRDFALLYFAVGTGGIGQSRTVDVQDRETATLRKLQAVSARDPNAPPNLPWDALEPRVLTSGDLLLEPRERDLCVEYVQAARLPAHLSARRRGLQRRLENAGTVDAGAAT